MSCELYLSDHAVSNPLSTQSGKLRPICCLEPPLAQVATFDVEERKFLSKIRSNYRLSRVPRNCRDDYDDKINANNEDDKVNPVEELLFRWRQQPANILLGNRNLPPLINAKAIDPQMTFALNLITDICPNIGGVLYILGALAFHPDYVEDDEPTLGSSLFAIGSFFFLIGSCVNFYKNNAGSGEDLSLSVNAAMYIMANVLYLFGSISFVPVVRSALGGNYFGITLFIIASVMFTVAPSYDLYRAHKLRARVQISKLSFMIELAVATMYIGGSLLFLIGSLFYLPVIYRGLAAHLYLVSSCCFLGANMMSPLANFWRFLKRVNSAEKPTLISAIARQSGQHPVDVLLGNRNLPPLVNEKKIDPRMKKMLTRFTTVCGNVGSVCYVLGSIAFYPMFYSPLLASVLYLIGGLVFLIGSSINFYKNDASSGKNVGLSVNAAMYIVANVAGIFASVAFLPPVQTMVGGNYVGITFFMTASVIFIIAPSYDMYRARQLRTKVKISYLSFVIEWLIAAMYIGGSYLFLVGCVFFLPQLYHGIAVHLFVSGSLCFLGANLSSPVADLWRYMNQIDQQSKTWDPQNQHQISLSTRGKRLKPPRVQNRISSSLHTRNAGELESGVVPRSSSSRQSKDFMCILNPYGRPSEHKEPVYKVRKVNFVDYSTSYEARSDVNEPSDDIEDGITLSTTVFRASENINNNTIIVKGSSETKRAIVGALAREFQVSLMTDIDIC